MKQIFLIGDSIRMGYCERLKELLKAKAEVIYPQENCRSSQSIIMNLHNWVKLCDPERVALVQFNCGQWDAGHFHYDAEALTSLREYKKNLEIIIRLLRFYFPKATPVFAATTPMNPSYPKNENPRTNEDISNYNEVARSVMNAYGVKFNDVFALKDLWKEQIFIDYCHLTENGYRCLADHMATYLEKLI